MTLLRELMQKPEREEISVDEYKRRQKANLPAKPTAVVPRKPKKGWPKSHTYGKHGFKEFHASQMQGRDVDVKA